MQPGWIDRPHHRMAFGDFRLESGAVIRDFELSYVLHGADEPAAIAGSDSVVLALSAISSTHHRLDFLIGPGKALDPATTIVIAVDAIGNGLTTSPSTSALQNGHAFPQFCIRDMVASQSALLDRLGVGSLRSVIGASMGGMQALQWAVSHPQRMRSVIAMTPMARTTPWAAAINETSRRALMTGAPDAAGWAAWVPLMQLLSGRTPRQVDQAFDGAAEVIDWIRARTDWWLAQGFAAVDWHYQSLAYDAHDVGTTPGFDGDTGRALASIGAPTLILAPPEDLYNPPQAARSAADGIPGAVFSEIPSVWGHQAATASDPAAAIFLNRTIAAFLARV